MLQTIALPGASVRLAPGFLDPATASELLAELTAAVRWRQENVTIKGKTWPQPRLVAWFGDAAYSYSGLTLTPEPLTPALAALQHRIEETQAQRFNSVLANRYVAGQNHGIGFHSDNEPELGRDPTIAMITLGDPRALHFQPKGWINAPPRTVPTPHGSLLVMSGQTQRNWKHGVPKERGRADRITLTFRLIVKPA